jgi:small subunit ribosomal protein S8
MLTRIRNAQMAVRRVSMPSSTLKVAVAKVLKDEGYIAGYRSAAKLPQRRQSSRKYWKAVQSSKKRCRPGLRQPI